MAIIVKNAPYILSGNNPHVNNENEIEAYRKLVLRSAELPEDTSFDINNPEIIKLFNKKNNSDSFDFTNLIINDNIYQISIFRPYHPHYDIPSSKMLFRLYDVTSKKYAILYESN
jgi:hypothetical protein